EKRQVACALSKLPEYAAAALVQAVNECLDADEAEGGAVNNESELKLLRDQWLGRKSGILTQINDLWLKGSPKGEKREVGIHVNELKLRIQILVEGTQLAVGETIKAVPDGVDITLPGIRRPIGAEHPVMRTMHEIVSVFQKLGYSVAEGPVVETDYYNFESLNFPPNHPARDTQDTLFIAGQQSKPRRERLLLRTHTSPVQIRTMEKMHPPIRI